jgi:hypothetical protein
MSTTQVGIFKKCKMQMTHVSLGGTYTAYLNDPKQSNSVPILGKLGEEVGSLGDSSVYFDSNGKTIFKTEVATVALVNANGKYNIDYSTGAFTGIAAGDGYPKVFWATKIISNT